ncbi:hypothetical protein TRIUR3_35043 [Triticum urartu]|uniref:HMA domain-containing protein n=1 Tax=Triticum urartu TaxID=4572 RepID=M7YK85_TRIUA|nr:hypothetical protein TRIUR3_35043 [Triticum urartu]
MVLQPPPFIYRHFFAPAGCTLAPGALSPWQQERDRVTRAERCWRWVFAVCHFSGSRSGLGDLIWRGRWWCRAEHRPPLKAEGDDHASGGAIAMADKISTVVLKVDLECARCYRKMRKVLCKIQDKMNIKTISFDEKSNSVTVSGPFDPDKLCRKLCCEAGRVIKEMHVNGKEQKADKDGGGGGGEKQKAPKDAGKAEEEISEPYKTT